MPRYRGKAKVDLQNQFIGAPPATSNAGFDYWRSNHSEWKDHKIGGQKEMISLTANCYAEHFCQYLALTPS
jgi:hypothetical protein